MACVAKLSTSFVMLYELHRLLEQARSPLSESLAVITFPTAVAVLAVLDKRDKTNTTVSRIGDHALNTADIVPLADRDPRMKAKYGMSIERAFERQLALLFTSFGYAVIESAPGQRQVDLLCVAASPDPASFVVEAKSTTAREYGLPATHERALIEHVDEVRRHLRDLPPLRLILVVAPSISRGAAQRLEAVARRHGVRMFRRSSGSIGTAPYSTRW